MLDFNARAPKHAVVVYLINHRSNDDYVLVAHMLFKFVSLSYAVGEWARVWPLNHLFKWFGGYFIRRRYREPLCHAIPDFTAPLFLIPTAINYDRVLEDRNLTEELVGKEDRRTKSGKLQTTIGFLFRNLLRSILKRFKRYGYAVVTF